MSLYDYHVGLRVVSLFGDDEFYGLVQALMRLADTSNLEKLKLAFPDTWKELKLRYEAPGGKLLLDLQEEA